MMTERTVPAIRFGSASPRLLLLGASFAIAGLAAPGLARAEPFVFTPPAGVSAYRLAFLTDATTDATSGDIATYNALVASEAALNLGLPAASWTAIASTASISAAANIACGAGCTANDPIFLVDGTEVATSTAALFAGAILHTIDENATGASSNAYVWTGSNNDGSAAVGSELGSGNPITGESSEFLYLILGQNLLLNQGLAPGSTATFPLYAISGEITVPEPMSASIFGLGAIAAGLTRLTRRRRPLA